MDVDDFQVTDTLPNPSRRGRSQRGNRRSEPYARHTRGNVDGNWSHDMFDGSKPRGGGAARDIVVTSTVNTAGPATVRIENLHWNVSEQDIWELMGSIGHELKNVKFFYDAAGRSEGMAEVDYATREGADAAIFHFHNRELDGQRMQLQIIEKPQRQSKRQVTVAKPDIMSRLGKPSILTRVGRSITERLGEKVTDNKGSNRGGRGGRGAGGGGSAGRGGGRGGRAPRQALTMDNLDAEMDAYMSGTGPEPEPEQPDLGSMLIGRREVVSYDGVDTPIADA
ncbi:hypothetical protein HDV00_002325 [Rhizophlyctis rosea]|nr:hypothetical protein HDV00_002325 [Rhizophlyctis rosea]